MKRSYYNNTSFLDLLFNFLLATLILLVIAVLNIVEEKNQADIKTEAEFVLTLEWNKNQDNDIDVWVEDPNGDMLWYRSQDTGIIHLDRDDRGKLDDHYENGKAIQINQEIVTFRGILPGEWCINEHFFRMGENKLIFIVDMKANKKDIGLVFSKVTANVAGVLTRNRVQAAPDRLRLPP